NEAVDESPLVEVTVQVEPSNDAPFTNHDIHVGTTSNVRGVSSSCGKRKMHPHVDSRGFQMESQSALHYHMPVDCTHVDIASCVRANRGLRRQSAQSISVDTQAKDLDNILEKWSDEHKKRRETGLKGEPKPDLTDVLISILEGSCKVEFQDPNCDTIIKTTFVVS
ncbi:hypothetical protein Tco_1271787, partial [Tanacetum coccineum]